MTDDEAWYRLPLVDRLELVAFDLELRRAPELAPAVTIGDPPNPAALVDTSVSTLPARAHMDPHVLRVHNLLRGIRHICGETSVSVKLPAGLQLTRKSLGGN
jgi:hypothetical protein